MDDGRMNGRTDGRMVAESMDDKGMDGWKDEQASGCMMDGWMMDG